MAPVLAIFDTHHDSGAFSANIGCVIKNVLLDG